MKFALTALLLCCAITLAPILAAAQSVAPSSKAATAVEARERAFARSMADRDIQSFAAFIDTEAVFFSGDTPLRGRDAIVSAWARYFDGAKAPFSWEPDQVEALASGDLALTSGPVRDPDGTPIGRFNSVWRRTSDGVWRVVFDKGCPICPAATPPAPACSAAATAAHPSD